MENVLQEVDSSVIAAVGYTHGLLFIKFNSGDTYLYFDVPYYQYNDLFNASSVGSYYNEEIKGNYESEKIG